MQYNATFDSEGVIFTIQTPMNSALDTKISFEQTELDSISAKGLTILGDKLGRILLGPYSCVQVPKLV